MIKRIVFDLDNTLIMWNDEYYNTLDELITIFKEGFNEFVGLKSLYENWLNDMVQTFTK